MADHRVSAKNSSRTPPSVASIWTAPFHSPTPWEERDREIDRELTFVESYPLLQIAIHAARVWDYSLCPLLGAILGTTKAAVAIVTVCVYFGYLD